MIRLHECTLIFVSEQKRTNGTIQKIETQRCARCSLSKNFSVGYYNDQKREMLNSINLEIQDFLQKEATEQIRYVLFENKRYRVRNVLQHNKKPRVLILDCEVN